LYNGWSYKGLCKIVPIPAPSKIRKLLTEIFCLIKWSVKIKNNSALNCIQIVGPKESMIKHASILEGGGGWGKTYLGLKC